MTVTNLMERIAARRPSDDGDSMRVPDWTLGDRMTKAMTLAGMSVGGMAESFDVSRQTVGRWLSDRSVPKKSVLVLWAIGCGVDPQWLETGEPSPQAVRVPSVVHPLGLEPRTQWLTVPSDPDRQNVNRSLTANRRGPILRVVRPVAA